jgi:hypothetical protein
MSRIILCVVQTLFSLPWRSLVLHNRALPAPG